MKTETSIKKKRTELKFTQEELAQKSKTSLRALQNYERGERMPDARTAIRIAKALETTVEELFKEPQ